MNIKARRGLAALGLVLGLGGGPLEAQTAPGLQARPAEAITLTKTVPVYEFENLKVRVDQYKVAPGDSLAKILKARGLGAGGDQSRWLRLVRELNPELKNPNSLTVGQTLKLPAAASEDEAPSGPAVSAPAPPDDRQAETVKIYERTQAAQQPARVVIRRRAEEPGGPEEPAADAEPASPPTEAAAKNSAGDSLSATASGPASVTAGGLADGPAAGQTAGQAAEQAALDFPSGNAGPLALEPVSKVVYRTVKVRRGDTLERLLRREGLPREVIYRHLLKVVLDLNPEIRNADLIRAGAELRIPAAGEYLAAAGLDHQEVRAAALAISQRRRPEPVRPGVDMAEAVRRLPEAGQETARSSLSLIFARLGDQVENKGGLILPGADGSLELDTAAYPLINTLSGAKVALDLGSTLPPDAAAALRAQNFNIFRLRRGETLDRALGGLWPLCGYYRVYDRGRDYEGGGDIRLRISADWIIWPTEAAWNSGQPLVINRVRGGRGSDPAWSRFLADHGLTVLDLDRNDVLAPAEVSPASAAPAAVTLDSANPKFLAAEIARQFGAEPKFDAPLELKGDRRLVAPLYWETGPHKAVISFGELSAAETAELRRSGFRVVAASPKPESAVEAVLTGFGLKAKEELTAMAPPGGPRMTLTVKGRLVTVNKREYFLTYAALPAGFMRLLNPELRIIRY